MDPERLRKLKNFITRPWNGSRVSGRVPAESCRSDEELLREVTSLLAQDGSGGPMERPLSGIAASLLGDAPKTRLAPGTN
jgi:hypothetical protein